MNFQTSLTWFCRVRFVFSLALALWINILADIGLSIICRTYVCGVAAKIRTGFRHAR